MTNSFTDAALSVIEAAAEEYKPTKLFALFSGGHDSLATTHVASQHPAFSGVVHINTGIGIPETNQFVRDTCNREGWTLHELHPATTYMQIVAGHGFPRSPVHPIIYRLLKERPLNAFQSKQKEDRRDIIAFAAGARSQESLTRMGNTDITSKAGARLWINPIHDWSASDVTVYIAAAGLKRNPVKDRMHISGECLCGCHSTREERQELEIWYPHVHEELSRYEEIVRSISEADLHGNQIPKTKLTWGYRSKEERVLDTGQLPLDLPMCVNCRGARDLGEVA